MAGKKEKKAVKEELKTKKFKKEKLKEETREKRVEKLKEKLEEKVRFEKNKRFERTKEKEQKKKILIMTGVLLGMIAVIILLFLNKTVAMSILSFFIVTGLFFLYLYLKGKLKKAARIRKIESVFPDFLQLMSSNLRAGMTIDRAILLSSRPEFSPLDKEILNVGKDITTGKSVEKALLDMSKRIKSDKINKTTLLIISGIRAGGNLAVLLEQTSASMRERGFVEKKAASNVLMYIIFIFIAASIGAPVLFSLSSLLVETLVNTLAGLPPVETTQASLPFTLSGVAISINFITYFSLVFIIVTNVLASLVLGLVNKGEEKQGFKYILPMIAISVTIFFGLRFALSEFIKGLFGGV